MSHIYVNNSKFFAQCASNAFSSSYSVHRNDTRQRVFLFSYGIRQTKNHAVLLLTPAPTFLYTALITATPVVIGIETPLINKRTSADRALFLCLQFLWQCAWENLRVRRFLFSGSLNPAYAVALLRETKGGSLQKLNKETVMSNHAASLHALSHETLLARIDALVTALEVANDHPQNLLLPSDHYILCQILHQHIAVLEQLLGNKGGAQ